MNHQGGMGQLNHNANNHNEVNPQSIGALGLLPSSSSLTVSDQGFPDRVSRSNRLPCQESVKIVPNNYYSAGAFPHESLGRSCLSSLTGNNRRFPNRLSGSNVFHYQGSNNIVPSNYHNASVLPHNMNLDAEYAGNDHCNNQNARNSSATVVEEQGLDGSLVDIRRLYCKRRSPEHTVRDLLVGESSSTAAQAGSSKRRASEVNASNSSNISAHCIGPASIHREQFEAGIGHGTRRPVADMLHLGEARQSENLPSNIHLHAAANQQAFLPPSISSMGYTRDSHVQLPFQPPLFYPHNHPPLFRSAETPVGAISSVQPFEHVPNFHETLQAFPWIDTMRPRSVSPSFLSVYTEIGSEAVAPFHNLRNIPRNIMLGPQIGRGNWPLIARNLSFANGTANFLGGFVYPSHYGFVPGIHPSNAPTWVPGFNFLQQYVQIPSGIVNYPMVTSAGFPRHSSHSPSNSNPSTVSQGMNFFIGFDNAISQNQHMSETRSENQAVGNLDLRSTSIPSPANAQNRSRLMTAVRNALEYLCSGGSLRLEDLMILDHSFILHLLEEHNDHEDMHIDVENMPYEELVALEEHIGEASMGLSEEAILIHLRQEKFQSIPEAEGSSENDKFCCICQDDYLECEDLGKLDCGHRFHFDCIKPWLLLKNTCPICKQIALAITDHDP